MNTQEANNQQPTETLLPVLKAEEGTLNATLSSFADRIKGMLPEWKERSARACAALSLVQAINSDEEDAKAEALLVKVRATYDKINGERLNTTAFTDGLKSLLMVPEKKIGPTDDGSEYLRVKKLRDGYAKIKADKIEADRQAALKAQARREEIARLKKVFEDRFFNNIVAAVGQIRESLYTFMKGFTLANFETRSAQMKIKPNIKPEIFNQWFNINSSLEPEDLAAFMETVKSTYTYELINGKYQEQAQPVVDEYIAKLPALKEELIALSQKSEEDAAKQKEQMDQQAADDLKKAQAEDERKVNENAANTTRAADTERLEATFATQLMLQETADLKGVRTSRIAVIDCKPEEIVQVFAKVLFACFSNKKFEGYLKTDKKGNALPLDENGAPTYTKWADTLLSFYADNCAMPIDGISFVNKVTTTQNSKKA